MFVPSRRVFTVVCRPFFAVQMWSLVFAGIVVAQTGGPHPLSELLDVSPEIALDDVAAIRTKARDQIASGLLKYRSTPAVPDARSLVWKLP